MATVASLVPVLQTVAAEVIALIAQHLPEIILYIKNSEWFSDVDKGKILELKGNVQEKARSLWAILHAKIVEDWQYFWLFVKLLFTIGYEAIARRLLPSHFHKGVTGGILTDSDKAKLQNDPLMEPLEKDGAWLTGDEKMRDLTMKIINAKSNAERIEHISEYMNAIPPLHPVNSSSDVRRNKRKFGAGDKPGSGNNNDPSNDPPPPPKKSHTKMIIIIVIIVIVVVVVLVAVLGGAAYFYSRSKAGGNINLGAGGMPNISGFGDIPK